MRGNGVRSRGAGSHGAGHAASRARVMHRGGEPPTAVATGHHACGEAPWTHGARSAPARFKPKKPSASETTKKRNHGRRLVSERRAFWVGELKGRPNPPPLRPPPAARQEPGHTARSRFLAVRRVRQQPAAQPQTICSQTFANVRERADAPRPMNFHPCGWNSTPPSIASGISPELGSLGWPDYDLQGGHEPREKRKPAPACFSNTTS